MTEKVAFSLRIEATTKRALEALAADRRRATGDAVTVADLAREALADYIARNRAPAKAGDSDRQIDWCEE